MRRSYLIISIAAGLVVFLAISALLARAFSIGGAEQSAITAVLDAQARGDAPAIVSRIENCAHSASCRERAAANAAALRHPGPVTVITLNQSAGFSLGSTLGTARVAWRIGDDLPIVQCVRVRRAGNVLSGLRVELLEISLRIPSTHACPARY